MVKFPSDSNFGRKSSSEAEMTKARVGTSKAGRFLKGMRQQTPLSGRKIRRRNKLLELLCKALRLGAGKELRKPGDVIVAPQIASLQHPAVTSNEDVAPAEVEQKHPAIDNQSSCLQNGMVDP